MVPWGSTLSVPTLAMKYFRKKNKQLHYQFKIMASTSFTQLECAKWHQIRLLNALIEQALHSIEKFGYSKDCFYCQNRFEWSTHRRKNLTTFRCATCNVPICRPTKGPCWDLHIIKGLQKSSITKRSRWMQKDVWKNILCCK